MPDLQAVAGTWLLALGPVKPVLTALALPPLNLLLLLLFGLWRRRPAVSWWGRCWIATAVLALWLLSCQSTAVWLARHMLPQYPAVSAHALQTQQIEAVVVLGGGIDVDAPEYGSAQLNPLSMERLRYGAWLARTLNVPLAFSGGIGWGNASGMAATSAGQTTHTVAAEAHIAQSIAGPTFGYPVSIAETASRDTRENGVYMAAVLKQHHIGRIALVTHAWHMPRAMRAFANQGMVVQPAPMGFTGVYERPMLDALPSGHGLAASRRVLREWLGLTLSDHAFRQLISQVAVP